jgi:hypothetical protein
MGNCIGRWALERDSGWSRGTAHARVGPHVRRGCGCRYGEVGHRQGGSGRSGLGQEVLAVVGSMVEEVFDEDAESLGFIGLLGGDRSGGRAVAGGELDLDGVFVDVVEADPDTAGVHDAWPVSGGEGVPGMVDERGVDVPVRDGVAVLVRPLVVAAARGGLADAAQCLAFREEPAEVMAVVGVAFV